MYARACAALLWSCLALPVCAQSAGADADAGQVRVAAPLPGPGLWKVSKEGHVLWVLGTHAPLRIGMEWRSREVEAIMAQAQEFIAAPSITAEIGWLRSLAMLPFMIGLKNNPDGRTLRDVLPADVHARWLALKHAYLGAGGGVERERPAFAAEALHRAGLARAGLTMDLQVHAAVEELARRHKLRMTWPELRLEVAHPLATIRAFKKSQIDDAACFLMTLKGLESDLDGMASRADAWARGDLAALRMASGPDRDAVCAAAILGSRFVREHGGPRAIEAQLLEAWLAAAERAMASNKATFAMLPLRHILDPHGYVAALEAKGYRVEQPE